MGTGPRLCTIDSVPPVIVESPDRSGAGQTYSWGGQWSAVWIEEGSGTGVGFPARLAPPLARRGAAGNVAVYL